MKRVILHSLSKYIALIFLLFTAGMIDANAQYCTPSPWGYNNYIIGVSSSGGMSDFSYYSGNEFYTNLSGSYAVSQIQGSSFTLTVNACNSGCSQSYCRVWIDWNQDGDFLDAGELVLDYPPYPYSPGATTFTTTVAVPMSAIPGTTRMRVYTDWIYAVDYGYPEIAPCVSTDWGEVEDYGVIVVSATPCSGTPTGGTASATPSSSGPSTSFTLSVSGASASSGLTYQWQQSADGISGWTDISGATGGSYTATAGMSFTTTYYRRKITCTVSGMENYSSVTSHTVVPIVTSPTSGTVTVSTCGATFYDSGGPSGNYTNYEDGTTIFYPSTPGAKVQITFTSFALETCCDYVSVYDGNSTSAPLLGSFNGTALPFGGTTITSTAADGALTVRFTSDVSVTPAGWVANISCDMSGAVPCSGIPDAGTASTSASMGAIGSTFDLSVTGHTIAADMIYNWQISEDGVIFTDMPSATTPNYTATAISTYGTRYYRLMVHCPTSAETTYSNIVSYETVPIYESCSGLISNAHAYYSITFHVENTNPYPIVLNSISTSMGHTPGMSGTWSYKLFYNPSAIYSTGATWTAGPIGSGIGGWVEAASVTSLSVPSHSEPYEVLSGFEIYMPPGSRYSMCLTTNSNYISMRYLSGEPGVYEYNTDGVKIITGDNIGWTGTSGISSSMTPSIYPYAFLGCMGFNIPCSSPTTFSLVDNTITTAEVSWVEPGTVPDEGYRLYITTTPTPPDPLSATPDAVYPIGTTSHTFTGLTAATTYYAWIVGDCGSSAYGAITGPLTFTTAPACNPPASVGFSTITHNSAYAAWPAPVPAPTEGYEYYYSDDPTPPSSGTTPMGTATLTFASLTDLASATTYYVWVRAVCYEDEPSPWSVMGTFTTLPGCLTPSGLSASATSWSTADVSWTAVVPAPSGGYDYYYSTDATAPTSGTTPSGSTTSTSVSLTGLTGSTTYYVWVRSDCGSPLGESGWSIVPIEFVTPLQNDDAAGAFEITVGGGCVSPYTNVTASVATDEPFPSCIGTDGYGVVWFKFTAPSSGQVKISNDYAVGGTPMGDSKIGLFEVGDVADYSTFTIVACDDDNGFVSPGKSILYAADLTPGMDYYVAVSAKTSGDEGDFCITIEEMDDSHLSALDDCTPTTPLVNMNEDYYGWLSIVDGSGNLIALVRPNAFAGAGTFSLDASQYIEGGSVRLDSLGTPYMDRNITINNTGNTITDADVRFYFLDSELADLDGVTLGTVGVSKYSPSSTCLDAYPTGIMPEYLTQEASGAIGTMRWVEVNVTGFSTFFLHGGAGPLDVNLGQLTAENKGAINQLFWSSVSEKTKELTYIIERSDDGRAFSEIGSTAAKGKASNYSFTDITPVDGINYYRVKAVDATNRTLYTNVAIAEVVVSNILTAYPNPTKDVVNVSIHKLGTNAKLSVTDVHGRVLQEIELGTQTHVQVNLEAYAQGTYYIKYSDDATSQTFKVNKQ